MSRLVRLAFESELVRNDAAWRAVSELARAGGGGGGGDECMRNAASAACPALLLSESVRVAPLWGTPATLCCW